ncbi:MAG: DUF5071 domain-containing protein [Clostridiales bacterium]|jgi:hypothetical protein|nr:DUF5071 domain-containing protein [Clostridiales bacterium]
MRWPLFAEILIKRGYAAIQDAMDVIFEWFQDINWPGALELHNFLVQNHDDSFFIGLDKALVKACEKNDAEWQDWLNLLKKDAKIGRVFSLAE